MNYKETLDYLIERLPMFQRIGPAAFKKDLVNTLRMMDHLGHPYRSYPTIHIGGTNGKGSVSHMITALLGENGYKTGIYTSPHYKDIRERIKIGNQFISSSFITSFVNDHLEMIESIQPSYFEMLVAMAFTWFQDQKVDWAVVEVGLGGRLDSTNVITPELAVITNISYDHQNMLGDTLEAIAMEKAGIIKSGIPVIISERQSDVEAVFLQKASEMNAPIYFASDHYTVVRKNHKLDHMKVDIYKDGQLWMEQLESDLVGEYQLKNLACLAAVYEQLVGNGTIKNDKKELRNALKDLREKMYLLGRMQIIDHDPLVIIDSAHNVAGIQSLLSELDDIAPQQLHFIFGMVNDKDPGAILQLMPTRANYYLCKPDIPRGLDAVELQKAAARFNIHGQTYNTVMDAYRAAKENAGSGDVIVSCGSIFVAAELL